MRVFQIDLTHENAHPYSSCTQTKCLFINGNFIVVEYTVSHRRPVPSDWERLIRDAVGETRETQAIYSYRRAVSEWRKDQRVRALTQGYKVYEANMLYSDNAGKTYGIFTRRNILNVAVYSNELHEKFVKFTKFVEDEYPMDKEMQNELLNSASNLASINRINFSDREIHASMDTLCKSIKTHIDGK